MKETAISVLALLTLFLLEVVSGNEQSLPFHLPINETFSLEVFKGINASAGVYLNEGECGMQGDGAKCPTGMCCSIWGWCGTTSEYCSPGYCQRQCPAPYPEGRCGWQADGGSCPTGQCCSYGGWCGTTPDYCAPQNCQSQCKLPPPPPPPRSPPPPPSPPPPSPSPPPPPPSPPPPPPPSPPPPPPPLPYPQCGIHKGGGKCIKTGECCSIWGWCGTTYEYCSPGYCQSQCNTTLTSSLKNRMRGIQSFKLNIV